MERLVETEADRTLMVSMINCRKAPFRVSITDGRTRSVEQNRLQWLWAAEAADQRGDMSPPEVQAEWKLSFGVPILVTENPVFAKVWAIAANKLTHEEQLEIMLCMQVTSMMTVDQLRRYLDQVQRYCIEHGIKLTDPEEAHYGPKIGTRVAGRDTRYADPFARQTPRGGRPGKKVP